MIDVHGTLSQTDDTEIPYDSAETTVLLKIWKQNPMDRTDKLLTSLIEQLKPQLTEAPGSFSLKLRVTELELSIDRQPTPSPAEPAGTEPITP